MSNVEMYTRDLCGYCTRAKALLDKKGVTYTEVNVNTTPGALATMIDRAAGRATVPQIFIGGRHIGGCDDLYALEAAGKLDAILAA